VTKILYLSQKRHRKKCAEIGTDQRSKKFWIKTYPAALGIRIRKDPYLFAGSEYNFYMVKLEYSCFKKMILSVLKCILASVLNVYRTH